MLELIIFLNIRGVKTLYIAFKNTGATIFQIALYCEVGKLSIHKKSTYSLYIKTRRIRQRRTPGRHNNNILSLINLNKKS